MCLVKVPLKNERDINFAVYNIILSKGYKEFTIDEIASDLKEYVDWDSERIEIKVKKLIQTWLKSGIIEEHINSFVRV